jgi:hypothetical protein
VHQSHTNPIASAFGGRAPTQNDYRIDGLRVRPKTSSRITEFSQHEADGCEFQERESADGHSGMLGAEARATHRGGRNGFGRTADRGGAAEGFATPVPLTLAPFAVTIFSTAAP